MPEGNIVFVKTPDGVPIHVYIVGAGGSPRPAIMMFSPVFGVDSDIMTLADRWAGRGYTVVAPDYFARIEPGVFDRSEEGRKRALARWEKLDVKQAMADIKEVRDYALGLPGATGKIAALGYCAGGELAFLCGTRLGVKAVAANHGTRIERHLDEAGKIDRATLHFGGSDALVPMDKVEAIRTTLKDNPGVDIHVYPGVGHGFSFEGRPAYDEHAAKSSDQRAQDLFGSLKQ